MFNEKLYTVRQVRDLKDLIGQSAGLFGQRDAFRVKGKDGSYHGISYLQFKREMDALGTALIKMGLKDCSIAIIGENRYEWCLSYMAVVNGVGVVVPLDRELPSNEIENLIHRSGSSALIFSPRVSGKIAEIASNCPEIRYFITMDVDVGLKRSGNLDNIPEGMGEGLEMTEPAKAGGFEEQLSLAGLIRYGEELLNAGDNCYLDAVIDADAMSILLFTSGTTDLAKGVMLSHKNICSNIMSVCSTVYVDENDSSLTILPLHHTYQCILGFVLLLYRGGTIAFNEGLKYITKNLQEVRPTLLIAVPLILENIYRKVWTQAGKARFGRAKLKAGLFIGNFLNKVFRIDIRHKLFSKITESIGGRVRLIITGAAAIDPTVSRWFRGIGIQVLQGYGLTECAPLVAGNRDGIFKDESVGMPIPGVQIKIVDPNENGIGEIAVRGDNVMLGYYGNPEATGKCMRDGWFFTGDMGFFDKDGFLHLTGRCKTMIVTKNGKKVFPEEVELYINKSPFVKESLVHGIYDKLTGETTISAQILPNMEAIAEKLKKFNCSREEIMKVIDGVIKNVNKEMPIYKRIKHFSIRDSEFVKTTTNKIKRQAVNMG